MAYRRSQSRLDFENRVNELKRLAMVANRQSTLCTALRDMIFQCAIFQTSAAVEIYLRLTVESWLFEIKRTGQVGSVPRSIKARAADVRLRSKFEATIYSGDEGNLVPIVAGEAELWAFMSDSAFPQYFSGVLVHEKSSYPSWKNIIRVLRRAGLSNPKAGINRLLRADGENYIEAFQSVRTAIAHSSPPQIQLSDVRTRLDEMMKLVGVLDRLFHGHVMAHGGATCWR